MEKSKNGNDTKVKGFVSYNLFCISWRSLVNSLWWWFVFLICWIPFCISPFPLQIPHNSNKKLHWAHFADRIKQRRKLPCSQYITFKNCNTIFLSGYVRGHCVCMMCTGKATPIKQTNKDKHNTRWWTQIKPSVWAITMSSKAMWATGTVL